MVKYFINYQKFIFFVPPFLGHKLPSQKEPLTVYKMKQYKTKQTLPLPYMYTQP